MDNKLKFVFEEHHRLFVERFERCLMTSISEDAIRYDFFVALINKLKLSPWQINIETPISADTYVSTKNTLSHRMENPKIDLNFVIDGRESNFEFALFKRNGNIKSQIDATARTYKMFNDFMRLAILNSIKPKSNSYFICVADKKILGYNHSHESVPLFPAEAYHLTPELMKLFSKKGSAKGVID